MAEAAVSFVIKRLGDLLIAEAKSLYGVEGQVEEAQAKLQWMRCFLKDADAFVRDGDERVRLWVLQIRETAYSLEDVIDTFVLKVCSRKRGSSVKSGLKRILNEGFVKLRKEVGSEIKRISNDLETLSSSLQTYGIRELRVKENYAGCSIDYQQRRELRRAYSHVAEQDVVGLEKDINKLVAELTRKDDPAQRVVSICGMGGLGKTTLARKVYHHPRVRSHFDCFAWASISQQCESRRVWEEILVNLTSPTAERRNEIKGMMDGEIAKDIYNFLKHIKCLVLLDDIWTTSAWDRLKAAFPEHETDSKILLTTRHKNVALHADINGLLHEPHCLDDNESWELFEKKANFGNRATTNFKDNERMKELGQEMLKYCAGLPLAVVVLGGLLSTKYTIDEWEMMRKNVKTYINKGKGGHDEQEYKGVSSVLSLSYDELPYHLKPCFLHLAHSLEDYQINVKKLCYTWIAEGFVSLDQQAQSSTVTVEDVAYDYLNELVERNMIQVAALGLTGKMKSCRLHDLMRDLSLLKAQEENFLQFIDLRDRDPAVADSLSGAAGTNVGPRKKVRRLAIYTDDGFSSDLLPFVNNGNGSLRSLVFINRDSDEPSKKVLKPLFNHFQLLRVLRLENYTWRDGTSGKLPREIGKLIHLRLLSLRNLKVDKIPSSIGNLRCLQTLDLRKTIDGGKIPNVIWRLEQLRHLYLPSFDLRRGKYLRFSNVSNLQTLYGIPTKDLDVKDFLQQTNLRKLVLFVDKDLGRIYHNSRVVTFNRLRSLALYSREDDANAIDITPVISCYPCIYKLLLDTPITKLPEDYQFSPNLIKLTLEHTYLKDDPMGTLEKLPNLRVLSFFIHGYMGNEMVCSKGGFPRLESLCFQLLTNLKEWRIEEGALTCLRRLKINGCFQLKTLPDGLRHLTTLKEVKIKMMPWEFQERIQGAQDFYKVQHVPSLVFLNLLDTNSSTGSGDESLSE